MRMLGFDFGLARIGVAVCDPTGTVATPHSVIREKDKGRQTAAVAELVRELEVEGLVVGIPYQMDGSVGEMAATAEKFAKKLEIQTGLEVVRWDERLTSVQAERVQREVGGRRNRKKKQVKGETDMLAACLILQSYLDSQG